MVNWFFDCRNVAEPKWIASELDADGDGGATPRRTV